MLYIYIYIRVKSISKINRLLFNITRINIAGLAFIHGIFLRQISIYIIRITSVKLQIESKVIEHFPINKTESNFRYIS